ncbi:MAG: hypothetical protein H7Z75_15405 [Ferruginibacter sp.]|nr:hypothetical protein [Cytophagales bacterium]
MDTKKKFYWLWAAIGLLLGLNVATIGWVIRKIDNVRNNRQHPEEFIARRLALAPEQVAQYQRSRNQMQTRAKPHEDSLRVLRSDLFRRIKQPAASDAVSDQEMNRLLAHIARQDGQITRLRFRHWQRVRALCTPEQQARFDQLISRIERGINHPRQSGLSERLRNRF